VIILLASLQQHIWSSHLHDSDLAAVSPDLIHAHFAIDFITDFSSQLLLL
jgi:hypothetical protein